MARTILYCFIALYLALATGISLWQHDIVGIVLNSVLFVANIVFDYWYFHNRLMRHEHDVNLGELKIVVRGKKND